MRQFDLNQDFTPNADQVWELDASTDPSPSDARETVKVTHKAIRYDYSDGDDAESYVASAIMAATDRSSQSAELESAIRDWSSRYHLSSVRGNLLRILNLTKDSRVLEIGCGCGAITRYLGEVSGHVDAVEGSARRARIAAARCVDLPNVRVFNTDANRLADRSVDQEVDGKYDVVTFIGVLEYAGVYADPSLSAQDAVHALLKMATDYLRDGGVVVIAIENRTGLKYLHGAGEDHYATPWLGLYDYPSDHTAGNKIRTYTSSRWRSILDEAGLSTAEFCLPFPDYKMPRLVLSECYAKRACADPSEVNTLMGLIEQTASEDHGHGDLQLSSESLVWRGIAQAGELTSLANSFLIVATPGPKPILDQALGYDFTFGPSANRRHCYRTVTRKPRGVPRVEKRPVVSGLPVGEGPLQFKPRDSDYLVGETLAQRFKRHLHASRDYGQFVADVKAYSTWLDQIFEESKDTSVLIDALPSNVMMQSTTEKLSSHEDPDMRIDRFEIFDLEWRCTEPVTSDFVLFRALVHFLVSERELLRHIELPAQCERIVDTVDALFTECNRSLYDGLADFIALESAIQKQTQHRFRQRDFDTMLQDSFAQIQGHARLYWSIDGEDTTLEHSVDAIVTAGEERQHLVFDLPQGIKTLSYLRLDPGNQPGYFHIYSIELFGLDQSGSTISHFRCDSGADVARDVDFVDIRYGRDLESDVFIAQSHKPSMVLHLDRLGFRSLEADQGGGLSLHMTMSWIHTDDFKILREDYFRRNEQLRHEKNILADENKNLRLMQRELDTIKASRVWRIAEKSRVLFYKKVLAKVPWLQLLMLNVSRRGLRAVTAEVVRGDFKKATAPAMEPVTGRIAPTVKRRNDYEQFVHDTELLRPSDNEINTRLSQFQTKPLISIVMPVYNVEARWLTAAIESVQAQRYENWELCLVDDCSTLAQTREELNWISHPRIHLQRLAKNVNIAAATNAGISVAKGDYIAFMDHDDVLDKDAFYHVVEAINEHDPDFIYTDEDFIDTKDVRQNPVFKPDFSPELLLSHNYITHLCVLSRALVDKTGGLRSEYDGAQDYDFVLRATELARKIHHIPKVLYHWRMIDQSTSLNVDAKPQAIERTRHVLEETLRRRGFQGTVENANLPFFFRTRFRIIEPMPKVSIIVPFKDKPEFLHSCIGKILSHSQYRDLEIIGVSNNSEREDTFRTMHALAERDSRVKFIEVNEAFNFSSLVNQGVSQATGEHIILMNNDVEIITWDWIEAMLEHSQRDEIGVVGGQLLFPDNFIQHAGITLGIGGYAGHPHKYMACKQPGYINRINIVQNMSALTGAFMMVKKSIYEEVGGFDAHHFKVACNDVDFCLRVAETGRRNVYTPYARAYHIESVSRGYEDSEAKVARFNAEKTLFSERHAAVLAKGDPFYNVNLSLDSEHFAVKVNATDA